MLHLLHLGLPCAGGIGGCTWELYKECCLISQLLLVTWVGTALCNSIASGARWCQAPAAFCAVHVTLQMSVKHLLLLINPGVMLIGLILNWGETVFQTPRTKPVKPQLGCSQGKCRWIWSNSQTVADRQVPVFSARTGDFETWPPAAAGWAAHLLLRGCPGWPLLC